MKYLKFVIIILIIVQLIGCAKLSTIITPLSEPSSTETYGKKNKPNIVVATRSVKLQTHTVFLKLPLETHRGEQWLIVKSGSRKTILTLVPGDPRLASMHTYGITKIPKYEIDTPTFEFSFISADAWSSMKRQLAVELAKRFKDLSVEQCERLIRGEIWIGLRKEHVIEALGADRILRKEIRETQEGSTEVWSVGYVSLATSVETTAKLYAFEDILVSSPSRPTEPFGARAARDLDLDQNTVMVLEFRNDELIQIVRRQ